ncbi:MAG: radical SAM protein, partial [Candidatus Thorarchaeota archaeon]
MNELIITPYEINYNDQKYFSNVTLAEYHIFNSHNSNYLFNVKDHNSFRVSDRLVNICEKVNFNPGSLITEEDMEYLYKYNLVAKESLPKLEENNKEFSSSNEENPSVVNMVLFLAQECNMNCVYCYGDSGKFSGNGIMSEETAFRAVDWLIANSNNANIIKIEFFGGEPLLNFSVLKRIIPYAKEKAILNDKRVFFSITTNGTLINDEIITFLINEKIEVSISFDGPPEYQNKQRPFKNGKGSYDKVLSSIKKMRESKLQFSARTTLWYNNDPLRIIALIEKLGFSTYSIVK